MQNRRNVIVGVLVFLTLILGGIAIYVAYQVTLQQSPTDSSADVLTICSSTLSFDGCGGLTRGFFCSTSSGKTGTCEGFSSGGQLVCSCQPTAISETSCSSLGGSCSTSQCLNGYTSRSDTDCSVGSSSFLCCIPPESGGTSAKTTLTSCTTTCSDSDGCTCPSGCNASGDINNGVTCGGTVSSGGSTGGGSETPVDTRSVCGGSCTTSADCKPAATSGIEVTCRNGICENAACSSGKTIPGANCACGTLNACGAPCSDEVGLCQSGSTCGFINVANLNSSSCLAKAYTTDQRCLPITPKTGYTLAQCGDIDTVYLLSGGSTVTSVSALLDACGQTTVVGSGTSVVCGDGKCGSSETNITCPIDCGDLPGTAIINDRVDAIIVGILLIFLGLSLYFRVDILKRK